MNELKVIADSRLEAVLRLKSKLGPDAVIVSERRTPAPGLPGLLGKKVYEVVARAGGDAGAADEPSRPGIDVDQVRRELEDLRETVNNLFEKGAVLMAPAAPPQAHKAWKALGVDPAELGAYADRVPTRELLAGLLAAAPEEVVPGGGPRVMALIGPSGAGKTITAAKLALRLSSQGRVGLLGMDYKKPGGMDQLRAIASALGILFEAVNSADQVASAFSSLQPCDLVIADTSAVQPGHGLVFEETRLALSQLGAEAVLVLSAAMKPKDALRFVDMTVGAGPNRVVYTHLDVTADLSALLAVGARWGLPIQYVSDGPSVEDIEPAVAEKLAERVLSGATA
ncbi:MAG: hypothetical protein AMXMBFR61_05360 [Fimbriimonadales bacterium]